MPIKRGHVAPQNTYIVTLIRNFDPQCNNFLAANALLPTKPIIYCSESLCILLGFTKSQMMLKSSNLKIFSGPLTTEDSINAVGSALCESRETVISICLYNKNGTSFMCKVTVTPVRDESGQLPLYLLFFHLDESPPLAEHSSKRSSFKNRINLKSLRTVKGLGEQRKKSRVAETESHSVPIFVTNGTKQLEPSSGLENDLEICAVDEITSDSSHPLVHDPDDAIVYNRVTERISNKRANFGLLRKSRPTSLQANTLDTLDHSPSHDIPPGGHATIHADRCKTSSQQHPRRPATWYRTRTSSLDDTNSGRSRPASARSRVGAHNPTTIADSEAIRMVLSSHPEPTKTSVSEKFAQFLSMDEDLRVEHRFQSPHMHKFTLKHYGVFKAVWDWVILLLVLYIAIATPYVTAFLANHGNKHALRFPFRNTSRVSNDTAYNNSTVVGSTTASDSLNMLRIVDIMVDVMFFVDIFINFRTTYVNKNDEVVSHPRRIASHYVKGWFFIDLVAAIPFDLIFFPSSRDQHTLSTSLLKTARLLRLVGIVRKLDRYSEYGASILLLLTASFALIAHWLACVWYAIGNCEHYSGSLKIGWLDTLADQTNQPYHDDDPLSGPDLQTKYITALYFTFSSLTAIGFGNVSPNTNAEKVFSIIVMLVGSLMYASIFGNVGALIQRLYSGTARYHAQMLRIKEFIRFHQIPSPLRQRLEEYSTQVWEHTNGIDMTMVQYSFPESLQSDICLYVYRDILAGSSVFKSLNDGCLRNLSLRIRSAHMPPSDTLIHTGDLLTACYYVVKGSLEVVTTDDLIVGVLNPGDFFGGLPTLVTRNMPEHTGDPYLPSPAPVIHFPTPAGYPPSITAYASLAPPPKSRFAVRALTYADVQFIDRHDLADLCHVYPELCTRLLDRFELTIPLVSSTVPAHRQRASSLRAPSTRSTLDDFLQLHATWNPVNPRVLLKLAPLIVRRSRPSPNVTDPFGSNLPVWELERLQRLFDHGALCSTAFDDQSSSPSPPPPTVVSHPNENQSLLSCVGWQPDRSSPDRFRLPHTQSDQQLRRTDVAADRLSPARVATNRSGPAEPTRDATDALTVYHLNQRFDQLERQIQRLENHVSTTMATLLSHLRASNPRPSTSGEDHEPT